MADSQSDDSAHSEQEQAPERYVAPPDYRRVALAYEERLAEVPADDAVLDTLRRTLEVYEVDIRQRARRLYDRGFPQRLALAVRLGGGFKPEGRRDQLGNLLAELIEDFDFYQAEVDRRIANVRHGQLPDGLEEALLDVVTAANILWLVVCEGPIRRSPDAAGRRSQAAIDYLAERLHDHVAQLRAVVYGPEDDPDEDGEGLEAAA